MKDKIEIIREINNCKSINELADISFESKDNYDEYMYRSRILDRMIEIDPNNEIVRKCILCLRMWYSLILLDIFSRTQFLKNKYTVEDVNNSLFLGFIYMSYKFNNDEVAKKHAATSMLIDIFYDTFKGKKFDVEKDLHKKYNKREEIDNIGINKAFVSLIYSYDPHLGDYVSANLKIMKRFIDLFKNMIDNFDEYELENEKRRYDYIIREIRDYCEEKGLDSEKYLFSICKEYGILDKVIENSNEYTEKDKDIIIRYINTLDSLNSDFNYIKIKNIIKKYFDNRIVDERDWYLKETDEEYLIGKVRELLNNADNISKEEMKNKIRDIAAQVPTDDIFDSIFTNVDSNKKTQKLDFKKRD